MSTSSFLLSLVTSDFYQALPFPFNFSFVCRESLEEDRANQDKLIWSESTVPTLYQLLTQHHSIGGLGDLCWLVTIHQRGVNVSVAMGGLTTLSHLLCANPTLGSKFIPVAMGGLTTLSHLLCANPTLGSKFTRHPRHLLCATTEVKVCLHHQLLCRSVHAQITPTDSLDLLPLMWSRPMRLQDHE